ncbi:MAG: hypothetical protein AAF488_11130 [Planctomycetota bacterium]
MLLLVALMAALPGCATVGRLAEYPESPQLFGGVRMHVDHFPFGHVSPWIEQGGEWTGLAKVPGLVFIWWMPADFVVSLALDTVLLPVTVPAALRDPESRRERALRGSAAAQLPEGRTARRAAP